MKGLTSNSNVNQLIEWLKEGKTVLYGPDQDYKNKRSVRTPSSEQVRQPIFRSGLDYWKNYESNLDELANNLKY